MTRPTALLLVPFALAACGYPSFVAKKTAELELPADVQSVLCESHNGGITVVGDAAATVITLRAEIEVRAHTQAEADATLNESSVVHEVGAGRLSIRGKHPQPLIGKSVSFTFSLRMPPQLALQLGSHNGSVRVNGVGSAVAVETHNGGITVETSGNRVDATTHNGTIRVAALGTGELSGAMETHNGGATIELGDAVATAIDASTHNGSIACGDGVTVTKQGRSNLRCQVGDGKGAFTITTHNGSVNIRRAAKSSK